MNNVYKIQFYKSSFDLDKDYENFSESEKSTVSSMTPESFFDFNDNNGLYFLYVILNPIDIVRYSKILDNNLVEYDMIDLSESILFDKIDIDNEIKPYVNALNRFKWTPFRKKINDWIYDRLEIDFVLDRINICGGIDNLRSVEIKFLKNFQN